MWEYDLVLGTPEESSGWTFGGVVGSIADGAKTFREVTGDVRDAARYTTQQIKRGANEAAQTRPTSNLPGLQGWWLHASDTEKMLAVGAVAALVYFIVQG